MTMLPGQADPSGQQIDPGQGQQIPAPPASAPVTINMPPQPPAPPQPLTNDSVAEMIERARREEKDKLYPQIEDLKGQLGTLTKEREEREAAEAAEQQRIAEEEKQRIEEDSSAKELLEQYRSESEQRFQQLIEDRDAERALREKEQLFSAVNEYKMRRLMEEQDHIIPELADFVKGSTPEEVEASILVVKEKTAKMMADIQSAQQDQRRLVPLPVSGAPALDPNAMGGVETRTLTAQEIRDLPMAEYAQYRDQLLGASSERVRSAGMYAP